jgi:hypothetical protein
MGDQWTGSSIRGFKNNSRRTLMKHKIARTTLLISVATLCLGVAPAMHAAETCSNGKAAGKWGFTLSGTLLPTSGPVLGAAVGTLTVDREGNFTGTEARNVGGGFANETIKGSWTVNSDCTASVTANIYESGVLVRTSVLAGVVLENSSKLLMVQESLILPDNTTIPVVITLEGNLLFGEHGH